MWWAKPGMGLSNVDCSTFFCLMILLSIQSPGSLFGSGRAGTSWSFFFLAFVQVKRVLCVWIVNVKISPSFSHFFVVLHELVDQVTLASFVYVKHILCFSPFISRHSTTEIKMRFRLKVNCYCSLALWEANCRVAICSIKGVTLG